MTVSFPFGASALAIREGVNAEEIENRQRRQYEGGGEMPIECSAVTRNHVGHRHGRKVRSYRAKVSAWVI